MYTTGVPQGVPKVVYTWVYLRVVYNLGIPQGRYILQGVPLRVYIPRVYLSGCITWIYLRGCITWVYLRVCNSGVPRVLTVVCTRVLTVVCTRVLTVVCVPGC